MIITIDPAAVRSILGDWAGNMTDDQLSSASIARLIEAEIASTCPSWLEIVDADHIATLHTAVAYLAAARLASSVGGVKSMTLGDQAITFNTNFIAGEQSRWRRDALSLIDSICPIGPDLSKRVGIHFGKASGRRG